MPIRAALIGAPMSRLLWLIAVLGLSGCATIIHGSSQAVPVSSSPLGATVIVDGQSQYTTPCEIELERKRDHLLLFTKSGYHDTTFQIKHVMSGAVAGNILAGGLIGWGVDAASGAQFKLIPPTVHVTLSPKDRSSDNIEEVASPSQSSGTTQSSIETALPNTEQHDAVE